MFGSNPNPFGQPSNNPLFAPYPFGTTSTTPFGSQTGASLFGGTSTGVFGTPSLFGASSSPAVGGSQPSLFGGTAQPFGTGGASVGSPSLFGTATTTSTTPAFSFSSSPASAFSSNPFGTSGASVGSPSLFGTAPTSSAFGASAATPGFTFSSSPASAFSMFASPFANDGFGQSTFGTQRGGSRVAPYTPSTEQDNNSCSGAACKLESISAMPVYEDKSHEELRWEDYQLGDKGGPMPASQPFSTAPASQPNPSPAFSQSSSSLFSNSTEQLFDFDSDLAAIKSEVFLNAEKLVIVKTEKESQRLTQEDELGSQCGPWSRLRSHDDFKSCRTVPSELVQRSYSLEAKSLKKRLISTLTCDENLDAESMVDLANPVFDFLSCIQEDSSDLLTKVKDLIRFRHEMSETERELKNDGSINDIIEHNKLVVFCVNKARIKLNNAKTSLFAAEEDNEMTKLSIKCLEEKLVKGEETIASLKVECRELEESFESFAADQRDLEKEIVEKQETMKRVRVRADVAKVDFERAKDALCSSMLT